MKYLSILFSLLLIGCATSSGIGYMTETKPNPNTGELETVTYSPYYEYEFKTEDNNVLARLVITLGPERVPSGYQHTGPFSKDLARSYRDGIVDWVSEIYFINTSNKNIIVQPTYIKVGNLEKELTQEFNIPPAKWEITAPLIELDSVYGTKENIEFKFKYNDKEFVRKGEAIRLSAEQVKEKYSN